MSDQQFATVHIEGVSMLRVVLECVSLNDGSILGFRVSIENRRAPSQYLVGDREITVRFFQAERQAAIERTYHDAYAWGMQLSGVMECDYMDKAITYLPEEG